MYIGSNSGLPQGLGQTIDLSTWTWEDWVLLGIGGVVLFSLLETGKAKATKAIRRRRRRGSDGSSVGMGTGVIAVLAAGALIFYLSYSATNDFLSLQQQTTS